MNACFQAADENILRDAAWSGTAPLASYALTTLSRLLPNARILYGSGSVTVTATLPVSRRGDLLVIPCCNADAGSGVLSLTNGAGLSVAIPVPAMPRSRIPKTIVCDLTALASAGTRTSSTWNVVFTGNSANVVLGGAILIYSPLNALQIGDVNWGEEAGRTAFGVEHENEYGTVYAHTHRTIRRTASISKRVQPGSGDLDALEEWFDNCGGRFGSGFLWPDPDVNDGLFGRIVSEFSRASVAPSNGEAVYDVDSITFHEFVKGDPL